MLKRLAIAVSALGFTVVGITTMAYAYKYHKPAGRDCGKVSFTGGFGGPLPSNVAKNSTPEIHTFIVRGTISCAQAKQVMSTFEMSINTPAGGGKGISPAGWKCGYNKKQSGQLCTNSSTHTAVANGVIYKAPKKTKHKKRKH